MVHDKQERLVFKYHNGIGEVYGDPLEIWGRMLDALGGDLSTPMEQARHQEMEVAIPALARIAEAVRVAFEMAPFNPQTGAGATVKDCYAVLKAWNRWLQEKKGRAAS